MNQYDPEALPARWELLTPHRDRVVATLRRRRVDYNEAEDVVHEAMLRLVQWDRLEADHAGGALMTVAQRVAIDRHRRSGRERNAAARFQVQDGQHPDEIALDRLEARHLAQVMSTLSVRERCALEGRAQGMLPRETAARSGMPARSVHLALSRARATLRAAAAGSWVLVLIEWLRRHPVQRVVQPVAAVAAGTVLALHIAGSSVPAGPGSGGADLPHAAGSTPAHLIAPARGHQPAPAVPGAATEVAVTHADASAPSSVGGAIAQVPKLIAPVTGLIAGVSPLAPAMVRAVAGTLAHAQQPLQVLAALPSVAGVFPHFPVGQVAGIP